MDCQSTLINEFLMQKETIEKKAKKIVLYGNSVVACILKISIKQLGFCADCIIFDNGKFLSKQNNVIDSKDVVVILCSSRSSTRNSMMNDSKKYFPDADVFDFYAIYYAWITTVFNPQKGHTK